VDVAAEPGRGSTFTVRLPAQRDTSAPNFIVLAN
jgi:hypothetical protein